MKQTTSRISGHFISLGLAAVAFGLVSCANGLSYSEAKSTLPPMAKGQGRVFVYRTAGLIGAAVKPAVKIDDKNVGTSEGRGFLYSDQAAGTHQISIMTEWNHKNTFTVSAGQSSFIECTLTPGVFVGHLIPNQVDAATGEAAIQSCKLSSK